MVSEDAFYQANAEFARNRTDRALFRGLAVRVGIQYGSADVQQVRGHYDYVGNNINIAARCEAAGHGGQIVVTDTVLAAVRGELGSDAMEVVELGLQSLRGVGQLGVVLLARQALQPACFFFGLTRQLTLRAAVGLLPLRALLSALLALTTLLSTATAG